MNCPNRYKKVNWHLCRLIAVIAFTIFISSFFAHRSVSAKPIVSLATTEWGPYVGEKLQDYGFTSEIIKAAFNRMGYEVRFAFMPPKRVMMQVEAGEFDAGYPAYYSDDRGDRFYYSAPFAQSVVGFYKRKDAEIDYDTLRDLTSYKIGTCLGFAYPDEFTEADYLQKEVTRNEALNLRKLLSGRIDLFITDRAAAQAAINRSVPEGKNALEFMAPPLEVQKLHLIFGKHEKNKAMLKDFNTGLQMIIDDGTVEKILKKHGMGHHSEGKEDRERP